MLKNIINFIKYHNLFTLAFVVVFVSGGTAFAASPQLREVTGDTLIGKTETVISVDNTALLNTNFDNFDPALVITAVSEDTEAYYVSYTFNTLAVLDGAWGSAYKDGELTVPKDNVNNTNLQAYVEEELKEVAQAEMSYLKEVKTAEQKKGDTKKKTVVAYTGLLGLVIDTKEKEVEYETVSVPGPTPAPTPEPIPTPEPTVELETTPPSMATTTATTTLQTIEETATTTPETTEEPAVVITEEAVATSTPSTDSVQATSTPNNPTDLTGQALPTTEEVIEESVAPEETVVDDPNAVVTEEIASSTPPTTEETTEETVTSTPPTTEETASSTPET